MSDDWNLVYSAIEDAYMTRKMRQQAREALNRLASENRQLREAASKADHWLNPDQGGEVNVSMASYWLRTTFPPDHPNYLTREYVEGLERDA